jgi:hypothetical protein
MFRAKSTCLGLLVATAMAGFTVSAEAATGQTCYFSECAPGVAAPAAPTPNRPTAPASSDSRYRTLAEHGGWTALADDKITIVIERFTDGAKFALVTGRDESFIVLDDPRWGLPRGTAYDVTIKIDGHVFTGRGTAVSDSRLTIHGVHARFIQALSGGEQGEIKVAESTWTLALSDAAKVFEAAAAHTDRADD